MAEDPSPTATDEATDNALGPAATDEASGDRRRHKAGDLPGRIVDRYFTEQSGLRGEWRLYEQARDDAPVIRDLGHRLLQRGESQAVVRDMVAIAAHRNWDRLRVTGSDSFRRMVAQEARTRGISIEGMASPVREAPADAAPQPRAASPRPERPAAAPSIRVDFRTGLRGTLLETGSAVYQDRPGRRPSPYADLRLADGQVRRAWGAQLPAALARADAAVGDEIELRSDDNPAGGRRAARTWTATLHRRAERAAEPEQGPGRGDATARNEPLGERFRRLDDKGRAADPELRAAQSQLIAAKALAAAYFAHNPATAALVGARLQESIAAALDKGGAFETARTRKGADGRQELYLDRGRRQDRPDRKTRAKRPKHPEITKDRDRGRRR